MEKHRFALACSALCSYSSAATAAIKNLCDIGSAALIRFLRYGLIALLLMAAVLAPLPLYNHESVRQTQLRTARTHPASTIFRINGCTFCMTLHIIVLTIVSRPVRSSKPLGNKWRAAWCFQ